MFIHHVLVSGLTIVGATPGIATGRDISLPPCTLLDGNGLVRDNATYSWTLGNLTLDTAAPPTGSSDSIGPRNVSFTVLSPDIFHDTPCHGARSAPDDNVWHACEVHDPNTWLTFSTDFLISNYVELNQTWVCQTPAPGTKRITMQVTGGESLGWFACNKDTIAVLEAVPGHCEHVQPLLSVEELQGAVTAEKWTFPTADIIVAASINVIDIM